jgi:hypothetical protein
VSIYSTLEVVRSFRDSLPEERKEQGQDEADDDTGHNGEVEAEPIPFDNDIPREPADPGDLIPQSQDQPYSRYDSADDDEDLS